MTDLDMEKANIKFREEVLRELRRRNLDCLNSVDLSSNAVTFFPLALPGNLWDGDFDGDYAHGIMKPIPLSPKNLVSPFWAESGTSYVGNDFLAEMVAEIQMMAPYASVSVAPVFKVPYRHDPSNKLNLSRKIHFDEDLAQYFMFSPYAVNREGDSICLSTEYNDDDMMRATYRAIWESVSRSIEPHMIFTEKAQQTDTEIEGDEDEPARTVLEAEVERLGDPTVNGFESLHPKMSFAEYVNIISTARRDQYGRHHPVVEEMLYRAGQGFVSYMSNLRLKHAQPYYWDDEERDEMVYPRYAHLYHNILNGMGAKWVHSYRLMYDPAYRAEHLPQEAA